MEMRGGKIAKLVKIYLDLGWWVFAAAAFVLIPLAGLVNLVMEPGSPDPKEWGYPVLVRVTIDESRLVPVEPEEAGEFSAIAGGQGELRIRTRSKPVAALVFGLAEVMFLMVFYVYGQLRCVFRSVLRGRPFVEDNARRIRRVGLALVCWSVVVPLIEYFATLPVLREVHVNGLILRPPIDLNFELLFVGLAILVLAEIFRQASDLQRDQSLTV
jgi:hypothetical protein